MIDLDVVLDRVCPAVWAAFHATYNLVQFAQRPDSDIPPPLLEDPRSLWSDFGTGSFFPELQQQKATRNRAEAGRLLDEFFAGFVGLMPIANQEVCDLLISANPVKVEWAGVKAGSPIAWVVACALRVNGLVLAAAQVASLDLSQRCLQPNDQAQLAGEWNQIRAALGSVKLPGPADITVELELGFAILAKEQRVLAALQRLQDALSKVGLVEGHKKADTPAIVLAPAAAQEHLAKENLEPPNPAFPTPENEPRPDGPEPPRHLWWKGTRYEIGKRRSRRLWRLLSYMWDRESATFEELTGSKLPWEDAVQDSAYGSAVNRLNNFLPLNFPWRLAIEHRCVVKRRKELPQNLLP